MDIVLTMNQLLVLSLCGQHLAVWRNVHGFETVDIMSLPRPWQQLSEKGEHIVNWEGTRMGTRSKYDQAVKNEHTRENLLRTRPTHSSICICLWTFVEINQLKTAESLMLG